MTESDGNIFEEYKIAAKGLVGGLSKSRAIELSSAQRLQKPITQERMQKLYKSMDCKGWKDCKGKNWVWRNKVPDHTDGHSDEVSLERVVAGMDVARWACQMSTSSGVEGSYLHRRRAIDLVRFIKPRHFAFIELKVDSDNPLYAAFEILGYALAYLHARANGRYDTEEPEEHNVFDAEAIELTILGPAHWHTYGKRGTDKRFEYKLDWLADEIARSLNDFVTAEFKGKPIFTMMFRKFSGGDLKAKSDFEQRATEIHHFAECEWWKC